MSEQRFYLEWGGTARLSAREIWPDGDAPETPTVDDVIAAMRKDADHQSQFRWLADRWNLDIEDVEVTGAGGHRSLARVLRDEKAASQ